MIGNAVTTTSRYDRLETNLLALIIWASCLVTFSLPGRESGGLDLIALSKLAVRTGTMVAFLYIWHQYPDRSTKRLVAWCFFPMLAYLCWAGVSVAWSPLKTVSVFQILGISSLVTIAAWAALTCRQSARVVFALKQLWFALFAYSLALILFHIVRPDISGLSRDVSVRGANGIMHPTYAGAAASLGFMLSLLGPKLIDGFQPKNVALFGLPVHGVLLFLANSRTALALTLLISLITVLRLYSSKVHSILLTTAAAACCVYLIVDPGFVLHKQSFRSGTEYITRGQSNRQLTHLSGRVEMWDAVWAQFELSPLIGHGYFVTSKNGRLDVWDGPSNHTAHNLVLQVLVSTGLIGSLLFASAFCRIGLSVMKLRRGDKAARAYLLLLTLFAVWYLGWCQTCISFIGPVLPESVAFFLLLGIGIGHVIRLQTQIPPNQFSSVPQ